MVIVQWMIDHRNVIFLVKSCWSPFHSRHTLPIHYRNLKSHQSSFPHFPCHCCIEFVDFFPWPSDSIPTTAPINSIIVAPSHCDEPILDGIFLSDFFTVNSWTMDENGRECHHLAIVHSMLISFFSYQTFLYNNEPDCRHKIRVRR